MGDVSLILTNTEKGEKVLQHIACIYARDDFSLIIKECNTDKYLVFNPHLIIQTPKPAGYEQFWKDYRLLTIEELYKKYSVISKKQKIKGVATSIATTLEIKWKIKYVQNRFFQLKMKNK